MNKKHSVPAILQPVYNTIKPYVIKFPENEFSDDELTELNRAVWDDLESQLTGQQIDDIINWINNNQGIRINGITWIRAYSRRIKADGIKESIHVNNCFSRLLKTRAILANGEAFQFYATRPGDSNDPCHRESYNAAAWGNEESCWYKSNYTYHITYDEMLCAGELYAVVVMDAHTKKLVYRFWGLRECAADDAMVFFNCYRNGERSDGWTDYKILASNLNSPVLYRARMSAEGLYINKERGYLMTAKSILPNRETIHTVFDIESSREAESEYVGVCHICDTELTEDDSYVEINGRLYCHGHTSYCEECECDYVTRDGHMHTCPECGNDYDITESDECDYCANTLHCELCNESFQYDEGHIHACKECGREYDTTTCNDPENSIRCETCESIMANWKRNQMPLFTWEESNRIAYALRQENIIAAGLPESEGV